MWAGNRCAAHVAVARFGRQVGLGGKIKDFRFSLYFSINAELAFESKKIARGLRKFWKNSWR
jgi:hypothetical protein